MKNNKVGVDPKTKKKYLEESKQVMEKYDSFLNDNKSFSKGIILLGVSSLIALLYTLFKG